MKKYNSFLMLLFMFSISTYGQTNKWSDAVDGYWEEASKWNTSTIPAENDDAVIDVVGNTNYTVIVTDTNLNLLNSLNVSGSNSLNSTLLVKNNQDFTSAKINLSDGGVLMTDPSCETISFGGNSTLTLNTNSLFTSYSKTNYFNNSNSLVMNGGSLEFNSNSVMKCATSFTFGDGDITFNDNSIFSFGISSYYISPKSGGTSTFTLNDNANGTRIGDHIMLYMGGYDNSTAIFNYNASAIFNVFAGYRIGYKKGNSIFNINNSMNIGNDSFYVGCGSNVNGEFPEGIVNITNGSLRCYCYSISWSTDIGGIIIGNGYKYPRISSKYKGTLNLEAGGSCYSTIGICIIGHGPQGEGHVNIKGGSLVNNSNYQHTKSGGTDSYICPLVLGFSGGSGEINQSSGTTTCSYASLYVGGASTNDLGFSEKKYHGNLKAYVSGNHDCNGTFSISGGLLSIPNHNIYVGADGTGVVSVAGTANVVANDIVLSNQVSSTLKFKFSEENKKWNIRCAKLIVTDASVLEVDFSELPGKKVERNQLISYNQMIGQFQPQNIKITGRSDQQKLLQESKISFTSDGIWLEPPVSGFMIINK